MKKKALLAALILAAALILTACAQDPEKHPLVAKWTQRAQDGRTQFTYSFEAVGDAEYYLWTWDDEENRLMQRSCVRLCATPWTAAHQAPPSLGFQARTLEWVAISFSNAWK